MPINIRTSELENLPNELLLEVFENLVYWYELINLSKTSTTCYKIFKSTPEIQGKLLNSVVESYRILKQFPNLKHIFRQLGDDDTSLTSTDEATLTRFANQYQIDIDKFNIHDPFIHSINTFPTNITNLQIEHLDSSPVRRVVLTGRLTVSQALARTQLSRRELDNLSNLQKEAICSGFTVTEAIQAQKQSCLTTIHLKAFKKGLATFTELASLRASQVQGLLLGLSYGQVLPEWFQGIHCRAIEQHQISYEYLQKNAQEVHQVKALISLSLSRTIETKGNEEGTPTILGPNITCLHLEAIKSETIPWVTESTANQFSEVEIRGLLKCRLTPEKVQVPWFSLAHCIALESRSCSYDDIRELTAPEVRGIACGLTRKEALQPAREGDEFTLQMARLLEAGLTLQAIRLAGALTNYQERAIVEHGLKLNIVTHPWFKEEHVYALEQGFRFDEIQGLTGPQAFGLTLGLKRSEVNNFWFSIGHVKALQAGLTYNNIKLLSGLEAEIVSLGVKLPQTKAKITQAHVDYLTSFSKSKRNIPPKILFALTESEVCGIKNGCSIDYVHSKEYSPQEEYTLEYLGCTPKQVQLAKQQVEEAKLPETISWEHVIASQYIEQQDLKRLAGYTGEQAIGLAMGLTGAMVQHPNFGLHHLEALVYSNNPKTNEPYLFNDIIKLDENQTKAVALGVQLELVQGKRLTKAHIAGLQNGYRSDFILNASEASLHLLGFNTDEVEKKQLAIPKARRALTPPPLPVNTTSASSHTRSLSLLSMRDGQPLLQFTNIPVVTSSSTLLQQSRCQSVSSAQFKKRRPTL